jgi:diguanylate cyclase (GGDEF)-like protein
LVPFGALAVLTQVSGVVDDQLSHPGLYVASTVVLAVSAVLLLAPKRPAHPDGPTTTAAAPTTTATATATAMPTATTMATAMPTATTMATVMPTATTMATARRALPLPRWSTAGGSLAYIASVDLLSLSQKPGPTGLYLAYLFPVIATAIYGTKTESAVNVGAVLAALSVVSALRFMGWAPTLRTEAFVAATTVLLSVALHGGRDRLEAAQLELRAQANTDLLTGAANRRGLAEAFAARRGRRPFVMVSIDVDHLKELNDREGHSAGDTLLREVAAACRGVLRSGDVLARLGGDEFAAFIADATAEDAAHTAARMRAAIAGLTVAGVRPTASIGFAEGSQGEGFDAVLVRADAAMYNEKRASHSEVAPPGRAAADGPMLPGPGLPPGP